MALCVCVVFDPLLSVGEERRCTQFYEMLDTVLMVLRRNPVPFLHVYHHAAYVALRSASRRRKNMR